MAVRNKRKSCNNCPLPTPPAPRLATVVIPQGIEMDQGLRLWKHVLFGTMTCINMIEGYAKQRMPGNPIEGVKHLRDRLNQVLNELEAMNDVPTDSAAQ